MIGDIINRPWQPKTSAVFYADGVSYFDGFIPGNHFLVKTNNPTKYQHKFTYYDGRIALREGINAAGEITESEIVYSDATGAPLLTILAGADKIVRKYHYAEYDESGRIKTIYRFSDFCRLLDYKSFSYLGKSVRITDFDGDTDKPDEVILHENGKTFRIIAGRPREIETMPREKFIRRPIEFGLKPLYPGFEQATGTSETLPLNPNE